MAIAKATAESPKCPLCGGDMPVEYAANFEQLTGRAEWHLPFAPRMKMCAKCNKDLQTAVVYWYKHVNRSGEYSKGWCQYDK